MPNIGLRRGMFDEGTIGGQPSSFSGVGGGTPNPVIDRGPRGQSPNFPGRQQGATSFSRFGGAQPMNFYNPGMQPGFQGFGDYQAPFFRQRMGGR